MFKAAVLVRQNQDLKILNLEPVEPLRGQVKVKMISAGLCGAQLNEITGVKGEDKYLPHLMGHEGFGEVIQTGEGVKKVKIGDRVVCHWRPGSGADTAGGTYTHSDLGVIGSGPVTTFSEETVVSENRLTKILPDDRFKTIYPLLGCALTTAFGATRLETSPAKNSKVLISGGGGLGQSLAMMLLFADVMNVTILDRNLEKIPDSLKTNCDLIDSFDVVDDVSFDFVYDTTGNNELISKGFSALGRNGQLVLVGQPHVGTKLVLNNPLKLFDDIKIFASNGGGFVPEDHMLEVQKLVENEHESFSELISHTIAIEDTNKGFELMRSGRARRIMIVFGEN